MESLHLDYSEDITRKLEKAPLHIKARIDERQKELLELVRQFYHQKYRELQIFARDELMKTDEDTISELEPSEPKLKSIVKRRPSSNDKRVSFINSPTQAPVSKSQGSPDTDATDEELISPDDKGHFDTPLGLTSEDNIKPRARNSIAMSMPALDLGSLTNNKHNRGPQFLDDGTPYTRSSDVNPQSVEPEPLDHEDLFNFQNELHGNEAREQPSLPSNFDEMAQKHHAPLLDPSPPRISGTTFDQASALRNQHQKQPQQQQQKQKQQQPQFKVGSAPISIINSFQGLDGDGGPLPLTEEEREEEASMSHPDNLSSLPRSKINELDPGSMSFSQRMEWETLRRRNGS